MRRQTIFYIVLAIIFLIIVWLIANLDALFPTPEILLKIPPIK